MSSEIIQNQYQKLSEKIYHLQNLELRNPCKVENLEYDLECLNNDMQRTLKDFDDKTNFIKKEISALNSNYQSKAQLKELNAQKIKTEMKKAEETLSNIIENHKKKMTNNIDEMFSNLENNLNTMITNQKENKEKLNLNLDKLKNIAEIQIPQIKEESDTFHKDSKEKINEIKQILKEEFEYSFNLVCIYFLIFIFKKRKPQERKKKTNSSNQFKMR